MISENDKIKQAVHLYAKAVEESFPNESDLNISFSPVFEQKMNKLIHRRKGIMYKLMGTTAKKAVSVAAALVIILSATMSVRAIREPVVNIIKSVFSDHIVLGFKGDTKTDITELYGLTRLPEGFEQTQESINDAAVHRKYENMNGDIIDFSQFISGNGMEFFIDNENSENYTYNLNGNILHISDSDEWGLLNVFWTENGYSFHLSFYGDFDEATAVSIVEGNEIIEFNSKD